MSLFLAGLRPKKRLFQVQTCKTHLNCCAWRLTFMDPLINVCKAPVTASGAMVSSWHPHKVTTLAVCRGTDMDRGEEGGHLCVGTAWLAMVLGSHQAGVRDRARGCSLPVWDRVEDNLKAARWSSKSRS